METRTFGWIQNPSDLNKLKLTVNTFDCDSEHYQKLLNVIIDKEIIYFPDIAAKLKSKLREKADSFTYEELVGGTKDKYGRNTSVRADQQADSLLKITILPQSAETKGRHFTDNWTADGFLRWAVTWGFVEHNRDKDTFRLTPLGKAYSITSNGSPEEYDILINAILAYPPAIQVLSLLSKAKRGCTKFYLGNQLGFRGEKGFTSYNEELMIEWFLQTTDSEERKKIKQDIEGTSDQYARMIAGWLVKLGLVQQSQNPIQVNGISLTGFPLYKITAKGEHALRQSRGSSKNQKIPQYIMWEFLAAGANANRDYLRSRRAHIIQSAKKPIKIKSLSNHLDSLGYETSEAVINEDIQKLEYFGINFNKSQDSIHINNKILHFDIPDLDITDEERGTHNNKFKNYLRENSELSFKFIELIDIAHDGNRNRDMEIITAELLKEIYGLNVKLLGGGRKPDILAYTDDIGIIIDTKAYKDGYGKQINQADEMIRYIEDNQRRDLIRNPNGWWRYFPKSISKEKIYFMWISSYFKNNFYEQVQYTAQETKSIGAALNVRQLLLCADAIQKEALSLDTFLGAFRNEEINLIQDTSSL